MAQTAYSFKNIEDHRSQLSYFNTDEGKMAYLDFGTGDHVIVLMHGVPTNSFLFRRLINPLVESGFRVIVPDMFGFGASD